MDNEQFRAASQRTLNTMKQAIEMCEGTLAIAERDFPGSTFVQHSKDRLEKARSDFDDMVRRTNRYLDPEAI